MNKLCGGDNLDVLCKLICDETIDLCYNDSPFNSRRNDKRTYNKISKFFDIVYRYDRHSIISDANGNPVGVIVPIEIWHEIKAEQETAYLTKSETMKKRLLKAKERNEK